MAWYTGQATTAVNTARLARELDTKIWEPDANVAPFLWLCRQNKQTTTEPKFESHYRPAVVRKDLVGAAGALIGDTVIPVDNVRMWRVYDTGYNVTTGECFFVTDIDYSLGTLTVTRGINSTPVAMVNDQVLLNMGSAAPEGDTRLAAVSNEVSEAYNYTQIYKHTVQVSRTRRVSAHYGISELEDQIATKERMHWMEMEASFMWQTRHIISSGDDTIRFTGGFISALGTGAHVKNQAGDITLAQFDTWAHPMCSYGNDNGLKVCLVNLKFMSVFNTLAGDYLQKDMSPENQTFGWRFNDYVAFYGKLRFHEHRMLSRMFPTTGACIMVDPDYVKYRPLTDSDTSFYLANDLKKKDSNLYDGVIGEYLTEAGLDTQGVFDATNGQSAHGYLYGITGAA